MCFSFLKLSSLLKIRKNSVPFRFVVLQGPAEARAQAGLSTGTTVHLASLAPTTGLSLANTTVTVVMFLIGFVLSGLVHLHRFGGRAVANVGHVFTLGISNAVMSILEDMFAVVSIILSFLAPIVMLVIVVIVVLILLSTFKRFRRGLRFLRGNRRSAQ